MSFCRGGNCLLYNFTSSTDFNPLAMLKLMSTLMVAGSAMFLSRRRCSRVRRGRLSHSPTTTRSMSVEASLEAAEDVNLRLGPDVLDACLDPIDHPGPHMMLLGARHHPLEEVLNLFVQPDDAPGVRVGGVVPRRWWAHCLPVLRRFASTRAARAVSFPFCLAVII